MEKLSTHQEQSQNTELISFFENHEYENVRVWANKNFNDLLFATKNGVECFIKKYNARQKTVELTQAKANTEISCYQHLPKEMLIEVIEANANEHYLALKKVEMTEIEINEQFVLNFTNIANTKFPEIDASFLPETTWEYYEGIFTKLREIEEVSFIDNAEEIINLFKQNRELIESSKQIFSHHDFAPTNVKKVNGKIQIFDFEFSRRDNAMHDLACVDIQIADKPELKPVFNSQVKKNDLFNRTLLDLMVIRRAVTVLNAQLSRSKFEGGEYFQKCRSAMQEKIKQLKVANKEF